MRVELVAAPLSPGALQDAFMADRPDCGAVVSFCGVARSEGGEVLALELEAYPGFTEAVIREAAAAALERFDAEDVLIVHRVGRILPGETIVFLAAAARRRRAAFLAADHLMDFLKSQAPFWKKSVERSGERWISPREEDYQDLARWSADGAEGA